MADILTMFHVPGIPRPQGSMTLHRVGDKTAARYTNTLYEWRGLVTDRARNADVSGRLERGPVAVEISFQLPRPKSHYGTGRNAGILKGDAEVLHARRPDLDKLIRAICDGISDAGTIWADDAQVASLRATKIWAHDPWTVGASIAVADLTADPYWEQDYDDLL